MIKKEEEYKLQCISTFFSICIHFYLFVAFNISEEVDGHIVVAQKEGAQQKFHADLNALTFSIKGFVVGIR